MKPKERMVILLVACALVAVARSGVRVEIPEPGELGRRSIEQLLEVPDDLPTSGRDTQAEWLSGACAGVVSAARSSGRLEATCRLDVVAMDSARDEASLLVDYSEGPQYRFRRPLLRFAGDSGPGSPPDRELPIRQGDDYAQEKISELLQSVAEFYQRRGWLDVSTTPEVVVDTATDSVQVVLDVVPGRAAVFGTFHSSFEGKHLTDTDFLGELWGVRAGDTLSSRDLSRFNRKLYRTRLFSTVRMERGPMDGDSGRTKVDLVLKERAPGVVEGALSWEPTFGWGLEGTIRHRNVLGRFHELSLLGNVAEREQHLRAGYATPLFFGTPISLDYGLTFKQQSAGLVDTKVSREFSAANEGTFSYPPTDWASVSLSLETERLTKYFLTGASKVQYQYTVVMGGALDFRDEPFDPVSGWTLRGLVGNGGQFGFDSTYTWVQSQGKAWVPLFWRFLSAGALEGGMFLNSTTVDGAGIFWQGGSRSVRSWKFNQAKVEVPEGEALRPRYLRASGELRFNMPWNVQVVGFEDWARLWNEGEDPDLGNLSKAWIGYGVGLRYRISLLSLRLDYAIGRGPERFAFDLAQAI